MIIEKRLLFILLCSSFTFAQNTLSLSDEGAGVWNINYISDADIGGFQFNVDGTTINSASGSYPLAWNANNLSSGVYFIQMYSGSFASTQKIMLIK